MRVSPVGVLYRSSQLDSIVRGAYDCSIPTHGGQSGICAAAAVAAAISASLDGCSPAEVLAAALKASKAAEILRPSTRAHTIADSLAKVHADLSSRLPLRTDYIEETYFPNTPETKVPLAISLALITESAESTALIAANVGGDSDSVASIGGAVAAALRPETVNESWFDVVRTINQDDIVEVALSLAVLRR
jgi:ADP-ribosylglycohydrolase